MTGALQGQPVLVQKRGIAADCHGCERYYACMTELNESAQAFADKTEIAEARIRAGGFGLFVTIDEAIEQDAVQEFTNYVNIANDWHLLQERCQQGGGGAEQYIDGNKILKCGAE